jgi:hypothetical protein
VSYSATKHAVHALTDGVRKELRGSGVELTAVFPGLVDTELAAGTKPTRGAKLISPDEVAEAVVEAIREPRPEVFVPRQLGFLLRLHKALPEGGRRRLDRWFDIERLTATTSAASRTAYMERIGLGRVVVLADPLVLCNGYLDKADNGVLLADMLDSPQADASVTFDEYHHGLTLSDFAPQAWLTTPWGAALLWLLVAVFFGLLLRGRRFGPLVERPAEVARSDAEWAVAVGELLRRSGARSVTLGVLARATERAVASYNGLPLQPRERFWNALWVRAPEVARELAQVEDSLHAASSERDLLNAARRLHAIAHPVAERAHTKASSGRPLRGGPASAQAGKS